MSFTAIPTEQTTAITDLILSLQAVALCVYLCRAPNCRPFWTRLWSWLFALLAFANLLGAIAHGVVMTATMGAALWVSIYLDLGLVVALFAVAAVSHTWDDRLAKRCLPMGVVVAIVFFAITLWNDSFKLFVVYESVTMLVVLVLYAFCCWRPGTRRGSGFLAAGVLIGLLAAGVELQDTLRFTCVWTFDNHGAYHLVQLLSVIVLSIGLYRSHLLSEPVQALRGPQCG